MTHANSEVLEFYQVLPFNCRASIEGDFTDIVDFDLAGWCPNLPQLLRPATRVLDVGCGIGWFACHVAHTYSSRVSGIDFNPVAVRRAGAIAQAMHLTVDFHTADLFTYEPSRRADVVVSLGVLHHTNHCLGALSRLMTVFAAARADVVVGLYHEFGRRPFLRHFRELKANGVDDEGLFEEYRRLHRQISDPSLLYSWFRDQVLHPHETQHTLREVLAVASRCGFGLVSTSLNHYEPIGNVADVIAGEHEFESLAEQRLASGLFCPGFFVTHWRRRSA